MYFKNKNSQWSGRASHFSCTIAVCMILHQTIVVPSDQRHYIFEKNEYLVVSFRVIASSKNMSHNRQYSASEPLLGEGISYSSYARSKSISSISSIDNAINEEDQIKNKLKWYFKNPYQKYKDRGRKPVKLILQIIKIILVTVQVMMSCLYQLHSVQKLYTFDYFLNISMNICITLSSKPLIFHKRSTKSGRLTPKIYHL